MRKLLILFLIVSKSIIGQNTCANSDFSYQNYANWTGDISSNCSTGTQYPVAFWLGIGFNGNSGSPVLMNTDPCNAVTISTDRHVIMSMPTGSLTTNGAMAFSNGYDPTCCNSTTGLYDLPMTPGPGINSIRIGSAYSQYTNERLIYPINVSTNNTLFTYSYAIVINGYHGAGDQSTFRFALKDANGNVLNFGPQCFFYDADVARAQVDTNFIQNSAGNIFPNSKGDSTYYSKWNSATVDLSAYIGMTVYAEFQTIDCTFGCHFCYAYVSVTCGNLMGNVSFCNSGPASLFAPHGFASYQWYGPNNQNPISGATNDTLQIVNGIAGDVYYLDCVTSISCTTKLVYPLQSKVLNISYSTNGYGGGFISGSGTATICNGNSVDINVQGASTYTWSPGGSNSDSLTVVPGSPAFNYTVMGTDTNGCVGFGAISLNLDTSGCVWPGDADENLIVNNMDLLPIGIKYGISGFSRSGQGINAWQGFACWDWTDTLLTGVNTKHVDCDGTGLINYSDTLAVYLNYGGTHPYKLQQHVQTANPDIYLKFNKALYMPGDTVLADVCIGDPGSPQTNFYGAAFTLDYDETRSKAGSHVFSYFDTCWAGVVNQSEIKFAKLFTAGGYVDGSLVRTTHANTGGYGKVAQLRMILNDTLVGAPYLSFTISGAVKTDNTGNLTSLNSGMDSVAIVTGVVGLTKNNTQHLSVFPNPSSGNFSISCSDNIEEIKVCDVLGKTVLVLKPGTQKTSISLENEGVYFVTIKSGKEMLVRKVIVSK